MYEPDLRRILRFAISFHRLFHEPRKGIIAHSAASRRLAENQGSEDGVGLMLDDLWPSFARVYYLYMFLMWKQLLILCRLPRPWTNRRIKIHLTP